MKDDHQQRAIDTAADAEQAQISIIRRAPVWKKCAQVVALNRALRALALADIRRRHPHAGEAEVRRLYAMRLLPPEKVEQIYGNDGRS